MAKSVKKKIEVDNTGLGNCMYNAYGISLMYFLRAKADKQIAEDIFDKLGLEDLQKEKLHSLLKNQTDKPFSKDQITKVIEPILAKATRRLAAEATKQEFLKSPEGTSLYTAANYGMCHAFKDFLDKGASSCRFLIKNDIDSKNYTTAEIYKVDKINEAMREFAAKEYLSVIDAFDNAWPGRAMQISVDRDQELALIQEDVFHKGEFLKDIIGRKTVEFFSRDNNRQLDVYTKHLDTNYRWGTEETLLILHRAIQGERVVRGVLGEAIIVPDRSIEIHIYTNGVSAVRTIGEPDMILNNLGNAHWTSLVKPEQMELKSEYETRNNILDISGFNQHLFELARKVSRLSASHPDAAAQAAQICNGLKAKKKVFLAGETIQSREEDTATFVAECNRVINEAKKDLICIHRGLGRLLNAIINVLASFATFGVLNLMLGKLTIVDPLKTDTSNKVSSLKFSLSRITTTFKQKNEVVKSSDNRETCESSETRSMTNK